MEREEFLKKLGLGVALVCTGVCFQECKKDSSGTDNNPNPTPGGGTTTSVDLSQNLLNVGDQTSSNGVLIFRIAEGNAPASFVATEAICPHQGGQLVWKSAAQRIHCNSHASEYTSDGAVTQQPQGGGSTRKLKTYAITISGNTLTAKVA